jgi:hypothetical protein
MNIKKNTNYDFEARKQYEETFVRNNSVLIQDITGASTVLNYSTTELDRLAGIDAVLQIGGKLVGIALRIRKPTWKQYNKRFTLGHHRSKPNSQIHTILNVKNADECFVPHLLLQVNGVDENGYCEECNAILIQTNVFAPFLNDLIETNKIESYYITKLDAYEFEMRDVWTQTDTGVDLYQIKNNTIENVWTNKESD